MRRNGCPRWVLDLAGDADQCEADVYYDERSDVMRCRAGHQLTPTQAKETIRS